MQIVLPTKNNTVESYRELMTKLLQVEKERDVPFLSKKALRWLNTRIMELILNFNGNDLDHLIDICGGKEVFTTGLMVDKKGPSRCTLNITREESKKGRQGPVKRVFCKNTTNDLSEINDLSTGKCMYNIKTSRCNVNPDNTWNMAVRS